MMKKLRCFLVVILALVMVVGLAGCGKYIYGTNAPSGGTSSSGGGGNRPGTGGDDDDDLIPGGGTKPDPNPGGGEDKEERVFTVTLVKDGVTYTNTDGIKAQWVSRYGVYSADFHNGVATIEGLDGEYHVTLSEIPQETGKTYTYDCNGYIANNNKRDIKIELLEILKASGGMNGWTELRNLGTYRATIRTKSQELFYYYYPQQDGWYSITSWVDTTANTINPKVNVYNGNAFSGFKVLDKTVDSGGASSTYTKNFRFEVKINWDEVGNNQIFGIMADSVGGYPVTVDFTVKYEGEYIRQDNGDPVYANGPFLRSQPAGSFRYVYKDDALGSDRFGNPTYLLDASRVKLKESGENAGFYHLYDEAKYASNGGWGPMLFAKLSKDTEIMWTVDSMSGAHIDMGFNWNQLNDGMVSCTIEGYDYAHMITGSTDDDGVSHTGYVSYCNSDGAHPVTEELKNFLQGYAVREWYFDDGEGWAENSKLNEMLNSSGTAVVKPGICLQSVEDNQWLFACGYYI